LEVRGNNKQTLFFKPNGQFASFRSCIMIKYKQKHVQFQDAELRDWM